MGKFRRPIAVSDVNLLCSDPSVRVKVGGEMDGNATEGCPFSGVTGADMVIIESCDGVTKTGGVIVEEPPIIAADAEA